MFVAGRGGNTPMLVMGRWRAETSVWRSIYPESFKQFGHRKKISALFMSGDRLMAVDNIVTPKFLVFFSLAAEGAGEPEFLELRGHGPYETIHSAAFTAGRLALLSGTGSMRGPGFFISIVDPVTAEEVALFESFRIMDFRERNTAAKKISVATRVLQSAQSVALLGNILAIACGREGLGLVRLPPRRRRTKRRSGRLAPVLNTNLRAYQEFAMTELLAVRSFPECDGVLITCSGAGAGYQPKFLRGELLRRLL
jgi:hypothetical protein